MSPEKLNDLGFYRQTSSLPCSDLLMIQILRLVLLDELHPLLVEMIALSQLANGPAHPPHLVSAFLCLVSSSMTPEKKISDLHPVNLTSFLAPDLAHPPPLVSASPCWVFLIIPEKKICAPHAVNPRSFLAHDLAAYPGNLTLVL
jgi:hypothetical protein